MAAYRTAVATLFGLPLESVTCTIAWLKDSAATDGANDSAAEVLRF